jgi:hypothetical protein
MITITIKLEEALGADKDEVSSQVTEAIYKALEQPAIDALFIHSTVDVTLGINPDFYPSEPYDSGKKGVEKTEANSCQVRYLGGSWVISEPSGDHPYVGIDAVIRHINLKQLYITNETIFTEEYAKQLWYKRK